MTQPHCNFLMDGIKAAGYRLDWHIEPPLADRRQPDEADNGGMSYVVTATRLGHTHVVRGPYLAEAMRMLGANLGITGSGHDDPAACHR